MANFTDFFFGSNIAVWEEAIGEIFGAIEDQRQAVLAAIYLSTAAIGDLNDRYAIFTGGKVDPSWQLEVFREHLQETIQAFFMLGGSYEGISQTVAATTMIRPILRDIRFLSRWLLGFQYLPNRFFRRMDGFICAKVDGPYEITGENNLLIVSVDGGPKQVITLPEGSAVREQEVIDAINEQIVGAVATLYGKRFCLETLKTDANGSILVDASSTADTLFGIDNFTHPNSAPPDSLQGTQPFAWRIEAPPGSRSNPVSVDSAIFGVGSAVIRATIDSPYPGLANGVLLDNGGFENDFDEWNQEDGPDFFITTSRSRSGTKALAVRTRQNLNNGVLVDVSNTLKTAKKFLATGATLALNGFHQASTEGNVFESSATPSTVYTWLTSNAVFGYVDKQESVDPIIPNPDQPTVKLTDPAVNFVDSKIQVGMIVHIDDGTNLFDGIIKGVATHDLYIDFWRNGPTGTPAAPHIVSNGRAGSDVVHYTPKAMVDSSKDFLALNVQTNATDSSRRDKIRVDISIDEFGTILGRQIVRDITEVQQHVVLVGDWGGSPTPFDGRPYFIYRRPLNGAAYKIFTSLSSAPTAVGQTAPSALSADFEYKFTYFDKDDAELGFDSTGVIHPDPSLAYAAFSLEAFTPAGTRFVQLSITVSPDPGGSGALATIDDLTWQTEEDVFTEFDVANDVRMQKIPIKNEAQVASGIITYTRYPFDGDKVTVSNKTYEFDTGAQASGVLTYSGQPLNGDTFQLAATIFEFDSDCVIAAGNVGIFIDASADQTFLNLRDAVTTFLGSLVSVIQDQAANTLTFKANVHGIDGNNIQFNKNSGSIVLSPATGFLGGGENPAVTDGNIPIPIQNIDPASSQPASVIDDPYIRLTSEINLQSTGVKATINTDANQITVQALSDGLEGNNIAFSSSVTSPPSFTLNPSSGFLTGGTSTVAGGNVTYTGQPNNGDVLVIGTMGYEFSNNNSGVCGNATPIFVHPSGIGFTYSGLVSAVNLRGEAIATLDGSSSKITFQAPTSGTAGNAIPFRKASTVLTINPDNGDSSAQTATGTNGTSRSYAATLATYKATATAPTVDAAGTLQTLSGISSVLVPITTTIPAGNRLIVCAGTNSTTGDPTPPVCTDSHGGTYDLDVAVLSGVNGRSYIYSMAAGSPLLAGTDYIQLSLAGGNTFSGVAVSLLSVFGICGKDNVAINNGSATSLTVGPTPALQTSGEFIVANFSVLGPSTDSFTAGTGYTLVGRVGTAVAPGQVTVNPEVKSLTSGHLAGAVSTGFANPDAPTCLEVAAFLNARMSGVVASCEITSGIGSFPNGRLVLTTTYSGVNSCLVVGHGSSNPILGFADDKGVCNEFKYRRPAWEIAAGGSGVVTLIARAVPPANRFFGTEWHLRYWTKAFHPSGISVSGLTISGIKGYVSLRFDSGIYQTSTPISITESPTVVEIQDVDPGAHFSTIETRMTFSGVTSGVRVVASEPYLINETDKSLHLSSHTIPRNKQREYKLHRLTISNPDSFTQIEAGLVGILDEVVQEPVTLVATEFSDLNNKNIFANSEVVATTGNQSAGTIVYSLTIPADGDTIRLGDDVYEFDSNFSIATDSIQVVIGPTSDITFANFVEQVLSNSTTHVAEQDTARRVVIVKAATPGVAGDQLVFTSSSTAVVLAPLTSRLEGGVDPIFFIRDVDYVIRYDTGQLARTGNSAITDPPPSDLSIDYSYFPGGIPIAESYPQTIKPVGQKVEPDPSANFFFFGRNDDFISISGIIDNFVVVPRIPSRFSYLMPIERGKFSEVIAFSGVGFSAPLQFKATTTKDALLLKNGAPVPQSSAGWQFQNDKTIVINTAENDPTAVYEFEYFLKYQYTTPAITIPQPDNPYVLLPYSYKMRNADEVRDDVQKVLNLDENRQATLDVPAITDQTLSTLSQNLGGETSEISDEFWQFIDETTVEIFVGAFDDSATYTLTYKSRRIEFNTPVDEQWEVAVGSGTTFGPFIPFDPGDKVKLGALAKFRVTASGDFDVDDYRVRSVAGILDSSDLSSCGFGLEPFGRLPFGGCGLETFEDQTLTAKALTGALYMTGSLRTLTLGPQNVGVLMFHPPGNGGVTMTTTNIYVPLGSASTATSSLAGAQGRMPVNIRVTDMSVRLRAVLSGGGTVTFKINVGDSVGSGSSASSPGVTISSGGQSSSFTGQFFAINQDQFACFEATFTGGTASASVQSISFAYVLV